MPGFPFKVVFDKEYLITSINDLLRLENHCRRCREVLNQLPDFTETEEGSIIPKETHAESSVQPVVSSSEPVAVSTRNGKKQAIDYILLALVSLGGHATVEATTTKALQDGWSTTSLERSFKYACNNLKSVVKGKSDLIERYGDDLVITAKGRAEFAKINDNAELNRLLPPQSVLDTFRSARRVFGSPTKTSTRTSSGKPNPAAFKARSSSGLTQVDYVEQAIRKIGRPARTNEIIEHLSPDFETGQAGGLAVAVRGAIKSDGRFEVVEKGLYTLTAGFNQSSVNGAHSNTPSISTPEDLQESLEYSVTEQSS